MFLTRGPASVQCNVYRVHHRLPLTFLILAKTIIIISVYSIIFLILIFGRNYVGQSVFIIVRARIRCYYKSCKALQKP